MPSSFIRSRCGVTLLNVSLILVLIGGLVIAGYAMMGPIIKRGKITDTKTTINSNVDAIMSWSVARGHIPGTEAQFNEASVNQYDAWGRKLRYLYDGNLTTASSTNAICNYAKTNLKINGIGDIAFAILSLGDDYEAQSSWNGAVLSNDDSIFMFASPLFSITTTPIEATLLSPDISRIVTLDELKARIGCFGKTGGRLRIMNNELPNACAGVSYSTTLYADGGVPPYTWSTTAPWSITADGKLTRTSVPTANEDVPITVTDSKNTPVQRSYSLKVVSCSKVIDFENNDPTEVADNWNGGEAGDAGVTGKGKDKINFTITGGSLSTTDPSNSASVNCIWFQRLLSLTGLSYRAYFTFDLDSGEGFVFGLYPSTTFPATACEKSGDYLGFGPPGIPGGNYSTRLGVRFDADPKTACTTKDGSICTGGTWVTGDKYHVRVEVDSTLKTFKMWLCPDSGAGACSHDEQEQLQNITSPYTGSLTTTNSQALTDDNIADLASFYMGFTAAQKGNNELRLTLSDLQANLFP